ncbi:uncharacterized protein LOC144625605 [Crassostrea virginica]
MVYKGLWFKSEGYVRDQHQEYNMKGVAVFFFVVTLCFVQSFEDEKEKCSAKYPSMKGKCPKEPCAMTTCAEAGAVCKNSYCGGCNAKWYTNGQISEACSKFFLEKE